jgi:hypothetical protein
MADWQTDLVVVGRDPEPLLQRLVETAGFAPAAKVALL